MLPEGVLWTKRPLYAPSGSNKKVTSFLLIRFLYLNMETVDKWEDAYIEKSAEFAKPILNHIREPVYRTSP